MLSNIDEGYLISSETVSKSLKRFSNSVEISRLFLYKTSIAWCDISISLIWKMIFSRLLSLFWQVIEKSYSLPWSFFSFKYSKRFWIFVNFDFFSPLELFARWLEMIDYWLATGSWLNSSIEGKKELI